MEKVTLVLLLFFSVILYAQKNLSINQFEENNNVFSFYVRIPNSNDLPTILSKSAEKVVLSHKNIGVQTLFNKYRLTEFIQAFPTSKSLSLKQTYLIKVNDIKLMSELRSNFPTIYTFSEEIIDEPNLLNYKNEENYFYTPNDFGLELAQTDLELINAQQAWNYTTGSPNTVLGIVDTEFDTNHPELLGTITKTGSNYSLFHGTAVAMNLAGNTNNGNGLASIGSDCFIEARTAIGLTDFVNKALLMSQSGVKILNGSWGSSSYYQTHKDIFDEIISNGTICVFAAGNTTDNTKIFYPAGYSNVISVTSIHHKDFTQPAYDNNGNYIGNVLRKKDTHDNTWISNQSDGSHNHTYSVDIAAPGYLVPSISIGSPSGYGLVNGTSNAAPIVTGTIGLMKSVNSNLTLGEVESILKLTSANIYNIPENSNYIDKLGSGRLDAGKAVEMAYKMALSNDYIIVENRDFYRDWNFQIKNAPYGIKIKNEQFRDSIKVDFTARNYIEIENTVINPNLIGKTILSIDPTIPQPVFSKSINFSKKISPNNDSRFFINKTFKLEYFLEDGVRRDFKSVGNDNPNPPTIEFIKDEASTYFNVILDGYCNASAAVFDIKSNYFEVNERGFTTLRQCDGKEETDFFGPLTGNFYMQNPAKKVNFQFSEDQTVLTLWSDENHKLVFEQKVLSLEENILEKAIVLYPNPSKEFINLDVKSTNIQLSEVSIFDKQGRIILNQIADLKRIDISSLSSGVYFLKIKNQNNISITKKIIKE
ncbi:S8 family serine peptidase [Polaribacter sp.]|uniref:S8 family serine peptidase n=1 Tax=Polaribacter sp. TaxID=1920175 RepID=UPI004047BE8D